MLKISLYMKLYFTNSVLRISFIFAILILSVSQSFARGICPDSIQYKMMFDLIDGDGIEFKHQFDSLVKVMYEFNISRTYHNIRPDAGQLQMDIKDFRNYPLHREYTKRIFKVLTALYDYDFNEELKSESPFLQQLYPQINVRNTTALLEMYLSDAPRIDADWLYDKWVKALTWDVMWYRESLYQQEREAIESISKLKGYPSLISYFGEVVNDRNKSLKKYFPDSKYLDCMEKMYFDSEVDSIYGILKKN